MKQIEKTVFISYRRVNSVGWAVAISRYLTQHGYDVFFDFNSIPPGAFRSAITANIRAHAHFLLLLTPSTLERCRDRDDWLRIEIETALEARRNIVTLYLDGFDLTDPAMTAALTGRLGSLKEYSGLFVRPDHFDQAMSRLCGHYLNVQLNDVSHPDTDSAQDGASSETDANREEQRVEPPGLPTYPPQPAAGHSVVNDHRPEWVVRISLSPFHPILLQNHELTRQLLEEPLTTINDDLVGPLIAVVRALIKKRRRVEIISAFSPGFGHPIFNPEEFTASLLADLVIQPTNTGYLKWLVLETSRIVDQQSASRTNVERIWTELVERYMDERSREYQADFQDMIHRAIRDSVGDKLNRMYPFFQLIWGVASKQENIITRFVRFLEQIRAQVGDAKPQVLKTLIVLRGQGERLINPHNLIHFQPDIVEIPAGGCCPYSFEAMRSPITNLQYATLCGTKGVEDKRLNEPHLLGPWEWQGIGGMKHRYPQVAEEIRAILENCEQIAHRPGYLWRVPTIAEWIRLSGCEGQSYPWGEAAPTPDHANLNFGRGSRSVKPVGSYPKGRSKFGADDCCGNIHELAWADELERLPESSRLMGGCYLTRFDRLHSSCRRIRLLSKREPDPRRNVGLRLVRVAVDVKRSLSLPEVLSSLELATDDD
jgi:hypothetical protein